MKYAILAVSLLALAACSNSGSETKPSTEADPTPQVDTDPTPDTGTGGATEAAKPDSTVNGAPGAKPMDNQPTPTDN